MPAQALKTSPLAPPHPVDSDPSVASSLRASVASEWLRISEAARLLGVTERQCRNIAGSNLQSGKSRLVPPPEGGKPTWFLHASLCGFQSVEASTPSSLRGPENRLAGVASSLSAYFPAHLLDRAQRKLKWLEAWRSQCRRIRPAGYTDRDLAARIVVEAKQAEGNDFMISVRSLQEWKAKHRTGGLSALVDQYQSNAVIRDDADRLADANRLVGADWLAGQVLLPPTQTTSLRSPDAVVYFLECYRVQNGPSIARCHAMTLAESERRGWHWPQTPESTVKWLANYDDISWTFLCREGHDAWARRFLRHVEIDYSVLQPGEMYVSDHHQCDFWVSDSRGGHSKPTSRRQYRPWLTTVQDSRTRCIVGWHLGPAPHQDAIISALRMAFRDWAIPSVLKIDNGKDFCSKLITGVTKQERDALRRTLGSDWQKAVRRDEKLAECTDGRFLGITGELGIRLIFATPYSPWSKGTQERFYGTFADQCSKSFATYCGNSTVTRPECLEQIRHGFSREEKRSLRKEHGKDWKRLAVLKLVEPDAVPTLDEAREAIGTWLDVYHRQHHQFDGFRVVPMETWNTATTLRRAVENELLFLMQARGIFKVTANGVSFKAGGRSESYGGKSVSLKRWVGREVFITLDPSDLSECFAWTPEREKRQFIGRLEHNQRVAPHTGIDDAREIVADVMRERKVMGKAARTAVNRTKTFAQRSREYTTHVRESLMTGTDLTSVCATAVPTVVRTGFEGVSMPVQRVVQRHVEPAPEPEAETYFAKAVPDNRDLLEAFDEEALPLRIKHESEDDGPFSEFL